MFSAQRRLVNRVTRIWTTCRRKLNASFVACMHAANHRADRSSCRNTSQLQSSFACRHLTRSSPQLEARTRKRRPRKTDNAIISKSKAVDRVALWSGQTDIPVGISWSKFAVSNSPRQAAHCFGSSLYLVCTKLHINQSRSTLQRRRRRSIEVHAMTARCRIAVIWRVISWLTSQWRHWIAACFWSA